MTWGSFFIDLILLLVIGFTAFISYKRGFVKTVIGTVGFFLSIILSLTLCTPLASFTYDKLIQPPVVSTISDEIDDRFHDELDKNVGDKIDGEKIEEFQDEIDASSDEIINSLPGFVQNFINQSGLDAKEVIGNANDVINEGDTVKTASQKVAENISQASVKPMAVQVLSTIFSLILFFVFGWVFRLLGKIISKFLSFTIAGKLDNILGGACGLVKGLIFALIFCVAIYTLVSFTKNGIWIFNYQNFESTLLFKLLISLI